MAFPVRLRMDKANTDRLRYLWQSGKPGREIAAAFGVSVCAIYKAARKMGLGPKPKASRFNEFDFAAAWESEKTLADIAADLGVTAGVVHNAGLRRGFQHRNVIKANR